MSRNILDNLLQVYDTNSYFKVLNITDPENCDPEEHTDYALKQHDRSIYYIEHNECDCKQYTPELINASDIISLQDTVNQYRESCDELFELIKELLEYVPDDELSNFINR